MIIVSYKAQNNNFLTILTAKMPHISQKPIEEIISYSEKIVDKYWHQSFFLYNLYFNLSRKELYSEEHHQYTYKSKFKYFVKMGFILDILDMVLETQANCDILLVQHQFHENEDYMNKISHLVEEKVRNYKRLTMQVTQRQDNFILKLGSYLWFEDTHRYVIFRIKFLTLQAQYWKEIPNTVDFNH